MSQKEIIFNKTSDLLNNQETAHYLGVAPETLNVWRSTNRYLEILPYIKVGRHIKYRKSALDAFLEKRTVGGNKL